MQDFVQVMKALSDPGRVSVVRMLERREMCACEIVDLLRLAQPTVSRHLRVLQDSGLVLARREGVWVHYRLPETSERPYITLILASLPGWLDSDPELNKLLGEVGAVNPCSNDTDCSSRNPGTEAKAHEMHSGQVNGTGAKR